MSSGSSEIAARLAPASSRSAASVTNRRRGASIWIRVRRLRLAGVLALATGVTAVLVGTGYEYPAQESGTRLSAERTSPLDEASGATPAAVRAENRRLLATLAKVTPRGNYIVIDRANNRLHLRRGETTLLEAQCSSGSGSILRDPEGNRQWVFDTPAGVFRVRSKTRDPIWSKPDWAFIEEGRPVPRDPADRIEYGSLGAYALNLGDGYLIHGTLYERLLGRSVTHGCIRLGREDLRTVYEATLPGTPVYIF